MDKGYRRRIVIEPEADRVTAELEDDYHRMVVVISHANGVVATIDSDMKRWPWTTCPGAIEQLRATFAGVALADMARQGGKKQNCTHLHDLAVFAAAHAGESAPIAYDVIVTDPIDGVRAARLARNGASVLGWTLEGDLFVSPADLAGRRIGELNDVIQHLDAAAAEAVRILRWASILALGRAMDIPAGLAATSFPLGSCYTFQPEHAVVSTRRPGVDTDFSLPGAEPLADRADMF